MFKSVIFCAVIAVSFAVPQFYGGNPRYARVLRLDNDIYPDGSYRYAYDTENGISADESGQQKSVGNYVGTAAQGSFQYTSPEGVPVQIQYTADENGFHPIGNVLPTPPPTPEAILRSLQYNAAYQPYQPYNKVY